MVSRLGFIGLGNMGGPMAANLARAGFDLTVYDVRGRRVTTLYDGPRAAGTHRFRLGSDLSSGVYFYRLRAGDKVETRKMILLK